MNIIEEYNKRKNLNYPISFHVNSSFLILRSDKNRWGSRWCFLCISWETPGRIDQSESGTYKISLKSLKLDYVNSQLVPGNSISQCIGFLDNNNVHFSVDKSWLGYEEFFYEWSPKDFGLLPVFDKDATLAAWEIFVALKESWFANHSIFFRNKLFETINPSLGAEKRLDALESFLCLEPSTYVKDLWSSELSFLKSSYLDWFKDFNFLWNK